MGFNFRIFYPPIRRKCLLLGHASGKLRVVSPRRVFSCEKLQQPNCKLISRTNPASPANRACTKIKLRLSMKKDAFFLPRGTESNNCRVAKMNGKEEKERMKERWKKREREIEGRRVEERGKDKRESAEIIVHQRSAHRSLVGIRAHPLFVA